MADPAGPVPAETLLRSVAARLAAAGIAPAMTEARLIFELAGLDRLALVRDGARPPSAEQAARIAAALAERLAGKPVARQRGTREFAGAAYALSPDTLEPRDDTMALIDAVTPFLAARPEARILDIGTGTGIIAITLLRRHAGARATATDIAPGAIAVAAANAAALGVGDRLDLRAGDLFADAAGPFDLIVSNPPYIPSADIAGLAREVRDHDPRAALDGGPDGLAFYRRIAAGAGSLLGGGGLLAVEIGHDQAREAGAIFAEAGWRPAGLWRDGAGRDRALAWTA